MAVQSTFWGALGGYGEPEETAYCLDLRKPRASTQSDRTQSGGNDGGGTQIKRSRTLPRTYSSFYLVRIRNFLPAWRYHRTK